jgi:CHAD domain-containing protein
MIWQKKWITGLRPDVSIVEAAQRTLWLRLHAVARLLAPAAERAHEDVEHVHRLRVATRRAGSALRLYEALLPKRRGRWFRRQLKRLRRAASEARDCDVLLMRLQDIAAPVRLRQTLRWLRRRRQAAQLPLVKAYERLSRGDRYRRKVARLLRRLGPQGPDAQRLGSMIWRDWAAEQLEQVVQRWLAASPPPDASEEALHAFRIRTKHLRYTMELLAGALPAAVRRELYPFVEQLQELLGVVNDHVQARAFLEEAHSLCDDPQEAEALLRLRDVETEHLQSARQRFFDWWTPQRREELQARFAGLLVRNG